MVRKLVSSVAAQAWRPGRRGDFGLGARISVRHQFLGLPKLFRSHPHRRRGRTALVQSPSGFTDDHLVDCVPRLGGVCRGRRVPAVPRAVRAVCERYRRCADSFRHYAVSYDLRLVGAGRHRLFHIPLESRPHSIDRLCMWPPDRRRGVAVLRSDGRIRLVLGTHSRCAGHGDAEAAPVSDWAPSRSCFSAGSGWRRFRSWFS